MCCNLHILIHEHDAAKPAAEWEGGGTGRVTRVVGGREAEGLGHRFAAVVCLGARVRVAFGDG